MNDTLALGIKVLVVDDEEELLTLLCYELKRAGFIPISSQTYRSALEKYLEEKPLFVLSDMRMPDGSGLDLFLKIKEYQPHLSCQPFFYVMTGYCKESPELLKQQGITDVLFKPFSIASLVSSLKSHVA
jgi:DNA-binding NtrC family response regulator